MVKCGHITKIRFMLLLKIRIYSVAHAEGQQSTTDVIIDVPYSQLQAGEPTCSWLP